MQGGPTSPSAVASVRRATSVVRFWTYGCGLLVLVAIGIGIAALVVALDAGTNAELAVGAQKRLHALYVLDGIANAENTSLSLACTQHHDIVEQATCMCSHFACDAVRGTCPLAPTRTLQLACKPCAEEGFPCSITTK